MLTTQREQEALIIASTFISFGGKLRKMQVWKEESTSCLFSLCITNRTAWFLTWGSVGYVAIRDPTEN